MSRETYACINGKVILKAVEGRITDEYIEEYSKRNSLSSMNNRTVCMSDSIELLAPFDGKVYTSKAKMRAEARARGLIEIGTENVDAVQAKKRAEIQREVNQDISRDLKRALQELGEL